MSSPWQVVYCCALQLSVQADFPVLYLRRRLFKINLFIGNFWHQYIYLQFVHLVKSFFWWRKKISFEYLFQSLLWWIPSRASHHGTKFQIIVLMVTLTSEAVTKGTWSNTLFPTLVSMNKLVILWKKLSTFAPSTADSPPMCFGSSCSRISAQRNCGVCDAMRAHLYVGNEPAHLAPVQVQSQVFYNIIKQTAETVGHTEKYLLN